MKLKIWKKYSFFLLTRTVSATIEEWEWETNKREQMPIIIYQYGYLRYIILNYIFIIFELRAPHSFSYFI